MKNAQYERIEGPALFKPETANMYLRIRTHRTDIQALMNASPANRIADGIHNVHMESYCRPYTNPENGPDLNYESHLGAMWLNMINMAVIAEGEVSKPLSQTDAEAMLSVEASLALRILQTQMENRELETFPLEDCNMWCDLLDACEERYQPVLDFKKHITVWKAQMQQSLITAMSKQPDNMHANDIALFIIACNKTGLTAVEPHNAAIMPWCKQGLVTFLHTSDRHVVDNISLGLALANEHDFNLTTEDVQQIVDHHAQRADQELQAIENDIAQATPQKLKEYFESSATALSKYTLLFQHFMSFDEKLRVRFRKKETPVDKLQATMTAAIVESITAKLTQTAEQLLQSHVSLLQNTDAQSTLNATSLEEWEQIISLCKDMQLTDACREWLSTLAAGIEQALTRNTRLTEEEVKRREVLNATAKKFVEVRELLTS